MSANCRLLFRCTLLLLCFTGSVVSANEEPDSSIWLSYGDDEADSSQQSIFMSLAVSEEDTIIVLAGRSESKLEFEVTRRTSNNTPVTITTNEIIETNQFYLGLNNTSLAPVGIDIGLEYSGADRELEFRIFKFGLSWFGEIVQLGLNYEYREIDIYTRYIPQLQGQARVEVTSNGIGPVLALYGDHWSWRINGMWYDYDREPGRLFSFRNLLIFGSRRFDQASSALDYYANSSLRYRGANWSAALLYSNSAAAIDNAKTDTLSLGFDWDISKHITLELELGRAFEEQDIETDFYSAGIGFRF